MVAVKQICCYTREEISTTETTGRTHFGFDVVCSGSRCGRCRCR
jgi:hypothetical protein